MKPAKAGAGRPGRAQDAGTRGRGIAQVAASVFPTAEAGRLRTPFAASVDPSLAPPLVDVDGLLIDRHRFGGGIPVDDLPQVCGQ